MYSVPKGGGNMTRNKAFSLRPMVSSALAAIGVTALLASLLFAPSAGRAVADDDEKKAAAAAADDEAPADKDEPEAADQPAAAAAAAPAAAAAAAPAAPQKKEDKPKENLGQRRQTEVGKNEELSFLQSKVTAQMGELEERMFRLSEALKGLEPENASRLLIGLKYAREELIQLQMKEVQLALTTLK